MQSQVAALRASIRLRHELKETTLPRRRVSRAPIKALLRPCKPVRKRDSVVYSSARTDFVAQLRECETNGDWLQAVEIVAEARALKEELPTDAIEVRCPGKRAHICPPWPAQKVFQSAPCKASVSWDTLQAVFAALLQANEPVLSMEILKDVDWDNYGEEAKGAAFNTVARTCARGEMLDEGLRLLEHMQKSNIDVGRATFDSLALGCLHAGRGEEAEQLFEERDYL